MVSYRYYLGPWVWGDVPAGDNGWHCPPGTVGCIDLRSLPDQGLSGTLGDKPIGFFATTSVLDSEYVLLATGDCREIASTAAMQNAWNAELGYRPNGDKLVDLLFDHLTDGSDPTGDAPTKTLMPTHNGDLNLILGGHSKVISKRFRFNAKTKHGTRIQKVIRNDYEQAFNASKAGKLHGRKKDGKHHLRLLDAIQGKYGGDWKQFVPQHLHSEIPGPLKHETTVDDDFDRADESLDASGWTEVFGNYSVVSNSASNSSSTSAGQVARYDTDLSSDDHFSECSVQDVSDWIKLLHVAARVQTVDDVWRTFYCFFGYNQATQALRKFYSGSPTDIATGSGTLADLDDMRIEVDGSDLAGKKNGSTVRSGTDTAITGYLRCGLYGYRAGKAYSWNAGDLGGAPPAGPPASCGVGLSLRIWKGTS